MGNLFYRGVPTESINKMNFFEMREWNKWHNRMDGKTNEVTEGLKRING